MEKIDNTTNCSICTKPFKSTDKRACHDEHLTSEYRYMIKGKRGWYSVIVGLTLLHSFLSSASESLILCAPCNLHLSKCFFPIAIHWFSHANNIDRSIFCRCDYYFVLILVCSSLSTIRNEMFHLQWYIINSCDVLDAYGSNT